MERARFTDLQFFVCRIFHALSEKPRYIHTLYIYTVDVFPAVPKIKNVLPGHLKRSERSLCTCIILINRCLVVLLNRSTIIPCENSLLQRQAVPKKKTFSRNRGSMLISIKIIDWIIYFGQIFSICLVSTNTQGFQIY